jgi:hypothetical protein
MIRDNKIARCHDVFLNLCTSTLPVLPIKKRKHLGDCSVVLVGMFLMYQRSVSLAEDHEGIHGPPYAVRPPWGGGGSLRGRARWGGPSIEVENFLVRKVQSRGLRNVRVLTNRIICYGKFLGLKRKQIFSFSQKAKMSKCSRKFAIFCYAKFFVFCESWRENFHLPVCETFCESFRFAKVFSKCLFSGNFPQKIMKKLYQH